MGCFGGLDRRGGEAVDGLCLRFLLPRAARLVAQTGSEHGLDAA